MSARAPAGNVNKKKGRDAAVDNNERNKGDGVMVFMTQVAAMSWAETQQPETTLASQSLQKTGFRSASQIEFGFVLIGWVPETRGASLNSIASSVDRKRDFFLEGREILREEDWRINDENDCSSLRATLKVVGRGSVRTGQRASPRATDEPRLSSSSFSFTVSIVAAWGVKLSIDRKARANRETTTTRTGLGVRPYCVTPELL
jgi:hypothetical protein